MGPGGGYYANLCGVEYLGSAPVDFTHQLASQADLTLIGPNLNELTLGKIINDDDGETLSVKDILNMTPKIQKFLWFVNYLFIIIYKKGLKLQVSN